MKKGSTATDASSGSRLGRIMKAPIRALCRVRDLYVTSLTGCAGGSNYRGVTGFPGGSFGMSSADSFHPSRGSDNSMEDDLRELLRAASQRSRFQQSPGKNQAGGVGFAVPRSQSMAIGRIDEDKPCEFGMDATVGPLYCPRSRSCAVVKRRAGVVA